MRESSVLDIGYRSDGTDRLLRPSVERKYMSYTSFMEVWTISDV